MFFVADPLFSIYYQLCSVPMRSVFCYPASNAPVRQKAVSSRQKAVSSRQKADGLRGSAPESEPRADDRPPPPLRVPTANFQLSSNSGFVPNFSKPRSFVFNEIGGLISPHQPFDRQPYVLPRYSKVRTCCLADYLLLTVSPQFQLCFLEPLLCFQYTTSFVPSP